jgi:hypothetical protein
VGSAATTPSTLVPTAVVLPVQYAVTVKDMGWASDTRGVGCRGRGFRAQPWATTRAPIATLAVNRGRTIAQTSRHFIGLTLASTANSAPCSFACCRSLPWSEAVGPAIRWASLKGHPPLRSSISEKTAGATPPRHLRGRQLSRISVAFALSSPTSATGTTRVIGPDGLRHDIVTAFDTLLTGSRS